MHGATEDATHWLLSYPIHYKRFWTLALSSQFHSIARVESFKLNYICFAPFKFTMRVLVKKKQKSFEEYFPFEHKNLFQPKISQHTTFF